MALNWMAARELVDRYNQDPRSFTDEEAEQVASIAASTGLDFRRESKPFSKAGFDFADIATFGLIPNDWRPTSRGESVYGETMPDKIFGGVGSVGGLLGAAGVAKGLYRGGKAAYGALRGGGGATAAGGGGAAVEGEIVRKSAEGITKTGRGLLPPYEGAQAVAGQRLLPQPPLRIGGPSMLELSAPQQKLLGPYRPADYASDYLGTSFNQTFSRYGQPQPF
jgi:hypothetical protein